jgi:hypothetical protein
MVRRLRHVLLESNEADPAPAVGALPAFHAQARAVRFSVVAFVTVE